jgi:hypothetical protein
VIRSLVALLLLVFSAASNINAQILGDRPISDLRFGPASGQKGQPAVASDGERFMAVWVDQRSSPAAVYAARFDRSTTLLDPVGIRIADVGLLGNTRVGVVWTGETYLVVWSDWGDTGNSSGIYVVRIDRDGRIIDEPHRVIEGELGMNPAVATNGTNVVVASWAGYAVLDRAGDRVAWYPKSETLFDTAVVRRGLGFLLLENRVGQDVVTALDENGKPLNGGAVFLHNSLYGSDQRYVESLACNDEGCVVLAYVGTFNKLSATPLDLNGVISGASQDLPLHDYPAEIVRHNDAYVVIGASNTVRLDGSGNPIGSVQPSPAFASLGFSPIAGASNGSEVGVAWPDSMNTTIMASVLTSSAPPTLLSRAAPWQASPAIATSGRNYLVSWIENDGVHAGRLTLDGQLIDGLGTQLTPAISYRSQPRVVFDGQQFLVALVAVLARSDAGSSTLYLTRLSADSAVPLKDDRIAVPDSEAASTVDLATDGLTTLVVWSTDESTPNSIMAARIDRAGQIIGSPVRIASAPSTGEFRLNQPSAAWNGTEWLVAWQVERGTYIFPEFESFLPFAIDEARLSPFALAPLDVPLTLSGANEEAGAPRVASNGDEFIIVWSNNCCYNTGPTRPEEVRVRHIAGDGTLLDLGSTVVTLGHAEYVVWDGSRYGIAVDRLRGAGSGIRVSLYDAILVRIGSFRTPAGPDILSISATPGVDLASSLVAMTNGAMIAAYTRIDLAAGGVPRAFIASPRVAHPRSVRSR